MGRLMEIRRLGAHAHGRAPWRGATPGSTRRARPNPAKPAPRRPAPDRARRRATLHPFDPRSIMSSIQGSLSKDRLGVPSVVFFVMSAAAPLTVVAGVVTTGYARHRHHRRAVRVHRDRRSPSAIFSVGYVAMSRHITNAGAFYTYVAHGLGRPLGVGAAWVALLAYNALQLGLYGIIGDVGSTACSADSVQRGNPPQWWVDRARRLGARRDPRRAAGRHQRQGAGGAALRRDRHHARLRRREPRQARPGRRDLPSTRCMPGNLFVAGFGAVLVITFLGFTGFESRRGVLRGEQEPPPHHRAWRPTSPSPSSASCTRVSSWAMSVATGPENIVQASASSRRGLLFGLAADRLPAIFVEIGTILFATSVLAADDLVPQHGRPLHVRARSRAGLPGFLSTTGRRSGAPIGGSLVQSLIGLVVIVLYAVQGWDPVVAAVLLGRHRRRLRRAHAGRAHLGRGHRVLRPQAQR